MHLPAERDVSACVRVRGTETLHAFPGSELPMNVSSISGYRWKELRAYLQMVEHQHELVL